jgi:hypothetical protein
VGRKPERQRRLRVANATNQPVRESGSNDPRVARVRSSAPQDRYQRRG